MANSPEKMNNGEDMSRLWYTGDSGESTEKTYEQWQEESMRRNAENLFPDDELAQEIASTNSLLEGETKEEFVERIRRAAEAQRVAESGPSRMETGESQDAYNKRISEATDAAITRENIISNFDHSYPLWGQLSDEQKREVMHAYPRGDNETTPEWQARVERELGVPVWAKSEAVADNGAANTGEGAGVAEGNSTEGASEGDGASAAATGEGAGVAEGNGAEGASEGDGASEAATGEGAADNKEAAKGAYRNDFENWEFWSDAERAAVLSLINTANAARKNAGEGGADAAADNKEDDSKAVDSEAADSKDTKEPEEESDEDKRVNTIIAMANGETPTDQDDNEEEDDIDNKEEKKGLHERIRNSQFGRKAIAVGLGLAMLVGAGLLLSRSDRNPGPSQAPGIEDTTGDPTPDINPDGDDGEAGENDESRQFSDTYFFYNTDARNVEKNSDIAFCNAGEVLTTCLAEHPEWSDFETNNDSYNALMNAAQTKLSETGREYGTVTAWQICKQTNGAYFGDFFSPDMTADEAEAVVDGMTAEQSQAFFAELMRAQANSSWSADTLNGSGFTSGIRDANLEGNTSDGFVYNVENCQEADLIILDKDFDGVNVQKQVFYDANGNVLGAIYMRVDLENATITTDPKGVVSIDDLSCCNIDVPDTPTPTPPETPPDTPTPTPPETPPDTPTPTPPETPPDTPTPTPPETPPDTPTPTPPETPPDTPTPTPPETPPDTPTPTPTPDEGKKPVEVRDGDTQLSADPNEGTDAPADTATFNPDTNNDGSNGQASYDQAPDSNTQVGAQDPNEQSAANNGNSVAQNIAGGTNNAGSNNEDINNDEGRDEQDRNEQAQNAQATQTQNNADTTQAAKKPSNRDTERRNSEAVENGDTSSIDQANAQDWANGDFDI